MLDLLPRRAVLGRLAAFPFVGAAGALVAMVPANAEHSVTLAKIDATSRRCTEAKQALEAALAGYAATVPLPHWTINYDDRKNALCRRWAWNNLSYPGGPRHLPDVEGLDQDYSDFWKANRGDTPLCRSHARLTRRLKARVKRYKDRVAVHIRRHRLDELAAAGTEAEAAMHRLASEVFDRPAQTMAAVQVQARMLRAYTSSITEQWATFQAGRFGGQLATNLQKLEQAA